MPIKVNRTILCQMFNFGIWLSEIPYKYSTSDIKLRNVRLACYLYREGSVDTNIRYFLMITFFPYLHYWTISCHINEQYNHVFTAIIALLTLRNYLPYIPILFTRFVAKQIANSI